MARKNKSTNSLTDNLYAGVVLGVLLGVLLLFVFDVSVKIIKREVINEADAILFSLTFIGILHLFFWTEAAQKFKTKWLMDLMGKRSFQWAWILSGSTIVCLRIYLA